MSGSRSGEPDAGPGVLLPGRAGTQLAGRYRLGPLLGRGGMADVHRAIDTVSGDTVAVKLLRATDPGAARRLAQEARALERLRHHGLVRLRDAGVGGGDGQAYLVMDLVEGRTLAQALRGGPLGTRHTALVAATIGDALAYAHAHGVVHRDVKPGNVLLDRDGKPHLADFGIASLADASMLTVTGTTLGTAAYMAPEQLEHHQVGPAADVWSLAMVLLECLLGRRVYAGSPAEVVARRLAGPVPLPPDLPAPWRLLLAGMFDHDPARRPSAAEVAAMAGGPAFTAPWSPPAAAAGPLPPGTVPDAAIAATGLLAPGAVPDAAIAASGLLAPTAAEDPATPRDVAGAPTAVAELPGHPHAGRDDHDPAARRGQAPQGPAAAQALRWARLRRWAPWLAAAAAVAVVAVATTVFGSPSARHAASGSSPHRAAGPSSTTPTTTAPTATTTTTTTTTTTAPPSVSGSATALLGAVGGDAASGALSSGQATTIGRDVSAALIDIADGSTASAAGDLDGAAAVVTGAEAAGSLSPSQAQTLQDDLAALAAAAGLPSPAAPAVAAPTGAAPGPPGGPGNSGRHNGKH